MAKPRQDRRQPQRHGSWWNQFSRTSSRRFFRLLLILAFLAVIPPIFFHFRLRRFQQMQLRKCGWLNDPPLVCAHGGDSTKAFPNTMSAYRIALLSQVDCIEIDVSRSADGVLFALHDRDLQRISGNNTAKVGHLSTKEGPSVIIGCLVTKRPNALIGVDPVRAHLGQPIKQLRGRHQFLQEFGDREIPTIEDALRSVSRSVRQVILDAKVGPPLYEKGLAKDILSVVEKTRCRNCLVWAKSDNLVRDVTNLSSDTTVGYIVMKDPSTGARTNLLRMKGARVVGVYHPLIDEKLVTILHGRNKKVYAWTVDDQVSMRKMLLEHVDAIVSSNPTLLQRLMQEIRTQCLEEGFSFQ